MSETRLSRDAHGLKSMLKYFHRDSVSCYPYVFLTSNWDVCTAVIVSYIQVLFFGNVSQQKKDDRTPRNYWQSAFCVCVGDFFEWF